jgi:hypothetical protein
MLHAIAALLACELRVRVQVDYIMVKRAPAV